MVVFQFGKDPGETCGVLRLLLFHVVRSQAEVDEPTPLTNA